MTTADYWTIANRVCTPKELETLRLRDQRNMSDRKISFALGISRWAVRERLDSADRKIASTLDQQETA